MVKKKRKWIEIETLKDGTPNIYSSFKKIGAINRERWEKAGEDKKFKRFFACVYCGREYTTAYRMIGHLGHCVKRKQFRERMSKGMEYVVGGKIFTIKTTKVKVLKTADEYEKQLSGKIKSGEMTENEAERLFYVFLKGAQSAISVGSITYTMRARVPVGDIKEKELPPLPPIPPSPPTEKEMTEEDHQDVEEL
jgi:hypothetical protein